MFDQCLSIQPLLDFVLAASLEQVLALIAIVAVIALAGVAWQRHYRK